MNLNCERDSSEHEVKRIARPEVKRRGSPKLFLLFVIFSNLLYSQSNDSRIEGLIMGSFYGDALGGPIEFQNQNEVDKTGYPIKLWKPGEVMNEDEIVKAEKRLALRSYSYLRPEPEPYAMWTPNAPPGTITDDSRNKIVLLNMFMKKKLKPGKFYNEKDLARAYLNFQKDTFLTRRYAKLRAEWLKEMNYSINQILDKDNKLPRERLWNGLPTCWGQMTNTPFACIFQGRPREAYLQSYNASFYDNGIAKDLNSSLIAGLSQAMVMDIKTMSDKQVWDSLFQVMYNTDPYRYNEVPWSWRAVSKAKKIADDIINESNKEPYLVFRKLDSLYRYNEKWEAEIPVVLIFCVLQLCDYKPLASLQLSIEWGWDTDTYPQLLGAFIGSIYGVEIFDQRDIKIVKDLVKRDYNFDVDVVVNELKGRVVVPMELKWKN